MLYFLIKGLFIQLYYKVQVNNIITRKLAFRDFSHWYLNGYKILCQHQRELKSMYIG